MVGSPNLNITHLDANAANPEIVVNAAIDAEDVSGNTKVSYTITVSRTLTQAELAAAFLHELGGTPVAAFNLNVPTTVNRLFAVRNNSGQTATVQVTGAPGTTVAIATGSLQILHSDGINVRALGPSTAVASAPFSIGSYFSGAPLASSVSPSGPPVGYHYLFIEPITFPAGLSGSYAYAESAPINPATFPLEKNGASIGSVDFAGSANNGTFTFAAPISFAAGDRLTLRTPDPQDLTLANVAITLKGTR